MHRDCQLSCSVLVGCVHPCLTLACPCLCVLRVTCDSSKVLVWPLSDVAWLIECPASLNFPSLVECRRGDGRCNKAQVAAQAGRNEGQEGEGTTLNCTHLSWTCLVERHPCTYNVKCGCNASNQNCTGRLRLVERLIYEVWRDHKTSVTPGTHSFWYRMLMATHFLVSDWLSDWQYMTLV